MAAIVETSQNSCQECSFCFTGTQLLPQMVFKCLSCQSGEELICCCKACAEVCHKDHDVEHIGFGAAYCDCHTGLCLMRSQTRNQSFDNYIASQHLQNNYRRVVQYEIENFRSSVLSKYALELIKWSKETFWLSFSTEPRFALEYLAKQIGDFHLRNLAQTVKDLPLYLQSNNCGYEWWIQAQKSSEEDTGRVGVDLHYDKDEDVAETFGVGMFPVVSTVTYLAYNSVQLNPTIVFDASITTPIGAPIQNCYISLPSRDKHIAFAGHLLHGAPAELIDFAQINSSGLDMINSPEIPRITFLVNIWIGHKPNRVEPIPIDLIDRISQSVDMTCSFEGFNLRECSPIEPIIEITSKNVESDEDGDWCSIPFISDKSSWGKEDDESGLEMLIWLPSSPLELLNKKSGRKRHLAVKPDSSPNCNTFHLRYPKHVAPKLEYEISEEEIVGDVESSLKIELS